MSTKTEWSVNIGGVSVGSSGHVSVGGIPLPTGGPQVQALGGSNTLAAMGVQVRKVAQRLQMPGLNEEVTRYEMRLPVSPRLEASFRKESWGDSLVKVFKKELQTGDPAFDKLVYISTDTLERTRAFLTPEMQEAISFTIDMGGTLEIDNENVVAVSGGIDAPGEDDRTVLKIVRGLLAFAAHP